MNDGLPYAVIPLVSVLICAGLAWLVLARDRRETAHWAFAAALAALALAQAGNAASLLAGSAFETLRWRRISAVGEILMPIGWLVFSLSFTRSSVRGLLREWRGGLWAMGILTILFLALSWSGKMFHLIGDDAGAFIGLGPAGRIYAGFYLVVQVLILANLEQALRQADEHSRWYLKFPAVGLGLLCLYFLYQTSDLLLYSTWHRELAWMSGAVSIIACALIGYGLLRRPMPAVPVYISPQVVTGSLTFLIVGGALIGTGIIAGLLRYSGLQGGAALSLLFVFLAVTALVFVLLSAQVRQALGRFVERHFFPHKYDYRTRWMEATRAIGAPGTVEQIAWRAVQLFKGIFGARTIEIWMADAEDGLWNRIGFYNPSGSAGPNHVKHGPETAAWLRLQTQVQPAEDPTVPSSLASALRGAESVQIAPLASGERAIGWVALGAPAGSEDYSQQDLDLIRCLAAQLADRLQHLVLANRLVMAREMEAFYEYSTFVLHDLKNFTATLSLVMQNAERHGGDPSFQQAAMRSVGATVRKMTRLMNTVAALSRDPHPKLMMVDLNGLAGEVLKGFHAAAGATLVRDEGPVPPVDGDPDQLQQVLLNLILNAQEAVGADGQITVRTATDRDFAVVTVEDNGCGMDRATMAGLFRPFRTTKGRGLGIGLYQCRKLIEAHGGTLDVESDIGKGSRFVIRLRRARAREGERKEP